MLDNKYMNTVIVKMVINIAKDMIFALKFL